MGRETVRGVTGDGQQLDLAHVVGDGLVLTARRMGYGVARYRRFRRARRSHGDGRGAAVTSDHELTMTFAGALVESLRLSAATRRRAFHPAGIEG